MGQRKGGGEWHINWGEMLRSICPACLPLALSQSPSNPPPKFSKLHSMHPPVPPLPYPSIHMPYPKHHLALAKAFTGARPKHHQATSHSMPLPSPNTKPPPPPLHANQPPVPYPKFHPAPYQKYPRALVPKHATYTLSQVVLYTFSQAPPPLPTLSQVYPPHLIPSIPLRLIKPNFCRATGA